MTILDVVGINLRQWAGVANRRAILLSLGLLALLLALLAYGDRWYAEQLEIVMEIGDDGVGFDPRGAFPGHLGLQSMRERIESTGGRLTVESAAGAGATIGAHIPVQTG